MSEQVQMQKGFTISPSIAILVAGVLIAAAIVYVNRYPASAAIPDGQAPAVTVKVPLPTGDDHRYGSQSAPITLVEYSDFQCPYCQIIYPTLKQIVDESGGEVAWVHRNFPLTSIHPQARPAALAAECIAEQIGNQGFWQFTEAVFADQSKMNPAYYKQLATSFGADEVQYDLCISTEKYSDKIDTESLDAQKNGGQGTPYTVVVANGKQVPISGALPYASVKAAVDSIR